MSVCAEIIKDKITSVCQESSNIQKYADNNVDTLLDLILEIQNDFKALTNGVNDLTELLLDAYADLDKDGFAQFQGLLKGLIARLKKLYVNYRKDSSLYSGIKTVLKEYKNSIDNLQESYEDYETYKITLPQDDEFISLVERINSLHA